MTSQPTQAGRSSDRACPSARARSLSAGPKRHAATSRTRGGVTRRPPAPAARPGPVGWGTGDRRPHGEERERIGHGAAREGPGPERMSHPLSLHTKAMDLNERPSQSVLGRTVAGALSLCSLSPRKCPTRADESCGRSRPECDTNLIPADPSLRSHEPGTRIGSGRVDKMRDPVGRAGPPWAGRQPSPCPHPIPPQPQAKCRRHATPAGGRAGSVRAGSGWSRLGWVGSGRAGSGRAGSGRAGSGRVGEDVHGE